MTGNRVCTAMGTGGEALASVVRELETKLEGATPVLVCAFPAIEHALGDVLAAIEAKWPGVVAIGASSAGEFTETHESKGAIAAWALCGDFRVSAGFATGLGEDPEAAVRRAGDALDEPNPDFPHRTAVLLLDALSGTGEQATLWAATIFDGPAPLRLVGGAAGDDLAMTRTFVGASGQAAQDALVLAMIDSKVPLGIGVRHGHKPFSEPVKVTRADGNVVHEIEGRPAWDVWAEQTRAEAASRGIDVDALPDDQVGAFLLTYEGSLSSGDEIKVRAPLQRTDRGALAFACAVPEGATMRITTSDPQGQVDSARLAAELARAQLGDAEPAGALVFDCICRNLILGDRFEQAVGAISEALGGAPVAGFETYGEIALDVGDMSGFHNTTSVVLAIPK